MKTLFLPVNRTGNGKFCFVRVDREEGMRFGVDDLRQLEQMQLVSTLIECDS